MIPPTMMTTSLTSWMMTFTMMNMKTTTIMSMKTTTTILVTTDRKRKKPQKSWCKSSKCCKTGCKTAKAGGKILFKFINLLLRMGTLLLIAWIIYLLGLHFLANAGLFGNIVSLNISGSGTDRISRGWCGIIAL